MTTALQRGLVVSLEIIALWKLKVRNLSLKVGFFIYKELVSYIQSFWLYQISWTECPSRNGYDNYNTGGCSGQNEIDVNHGKSLDECALQCNQDSTCISFEYEKPCDGCDTCQLSATCTYNMTVKDPSDSFCFYEKNFDKWNGKVFYFTNYRYIMFL